MKNPKKEIQFSNESKMDKYLSCRKKHCDNDVGNTSIVIRIEIIKKVKDLRENQGFS